MSRNEREGHFAGSSHGRMVRYRSRLFKRRVRSAKARAVLRLRWCRANGRPFPFTRMADQQGAQ